ncbi:DEAD-box ATP-dependent RNA helicase 58, chloroplastic-like, partial [Euphorbia lathyris]|uniref:DEAD-box ATP-dependent RNA helicase 58, chloroplastic-like n=1 Tax=Euphorbia lathyris TaxID=212925 RepID=UPI0033134875
FRRGKACATSTSQVLSFSKGISFSKHWKLQSTRPCRWFPFNFTYPIPFGTPKFTTLRAALDSSPHIISKEKSAANHNNASNLREICQDQVPEQVLCRMEEVGYVVATDVQREALPVLFSRQDCILHAETGSGKTLAYLLLIFSIVNPERSAVQALIVVPTRELGMQVAKVARTLAAKPVDVTVMALLDGGLLKRQKSWQTTPSPSNG